MKAALFILFAHKISCEHNSAKPYEAVEHGDKVLPQQQGAYAPRKATAGAESSAILTVTFNRTAVAMISSRSKMRLWPTEVPDPHKTPPRCGLRLDGKVADALP